MTKRRSLFIVLGLLMLLAASGLTIYNEAEGSSAAARSEDIALWLGQRIETRAADPNAHRTDLETLRLAELTGQWPDMPTEERDGVAWLGILEIPELELSLPVRADWSMEALTAAPCRYSGSYFAGDFVICGHNYRGHFMPLLDIPIGAEVCFVNVEGSVFRYTVTNREILPPSAVEEMIQPDGWDLTLFTCTFGARTRCAVRCERVPES